VFVALAAGTLVTAGACMWGTRPKQFGPAIGPQGVTLAFRLRGESAMRSAELFAVDSLGLIVHGPRLVHVAWERLELVDVRGLGSDYDLVRAGVPPADRRARLALVSRFPQGLSGDLLSRVLVAVAQRGIEELQ
jgi:hypothetical protein